MKTQWTNQHKSETTVGKAIGASPWRSRITFTQKRENFLVPGYHHFEPRRDDTVKLLFCVLLRKAYNCC